MHLCTPDSYNSPISSQTDCIESPYVNSGSQEEGLELFFKLAALLFAADAADKPRFIIS